MNYQPEMTEAARWYVLLQDDGSCDYFLASEHDYPEVLAAAKSNDHFGLTVGYGVRSANSAKWRVYPTRKQALRDFWAD